MLCMTMETPDVLTSYGLVTPYGVIDFVLHWIREWSID